MLGIIGPEGIQVQITVRYSQPKRAAPLGKIDRTNCWSGRAAAGTPVWTVAQPPGKRLAASCSLAP